MFPGFFLKTQIQPLCLKPFSDASLQIENKIEIVYHYRIQHYLNDSTLPLSPLYFPPGKFLSTSRITIVLLFLGVLSFEKPSLLPTLTPYHGSLFLFGALAAVYNCVHLLLLFS